MTRRADDYGIHKQIFDLKEILKRRKFGKYIFSITLPSGNSALKYSLF